jgi:hypothetical protein
MAHDTTSTRAERPPSYRIEVLGHLPAGLAAEFADFTIQPGPHTTLSGPVTDPAALYGLIARLESLGLTLLSVHPHEADSDPNGSLGPSPQTRTSRVRGPASPIAHSSNVEAVHPRNQGHDDV